MEYRWHWTFWHCGWRWACTFHIFCVDFICVWCPTQTQFPVEYGLYCLSPFLPSVNVTQRKFGFCWNMGFMVGNSAPIHSLLNSILTENTHTCPHCNVTQDVQHIILACDHPAVKAKRENFLARYAKYVKSFDVDTSRNKLRELLN